MKTGRYLFPTILAVALLLATAAPSRAQTPGTVDATYNPNVTGSYVLTTAVQPDGKTIIGGVFTNVGGAAHANIARLNPDGSADGLFSASTNNGVNSVVALADGSILIGRLHRSERHSVQSHRAAQR